MQLEVYARLDRTIEKVSPAQLIGKYSLTVRGGRDGPVGPLELQLAAMLAQTGFGRRRVSSLYTQSAIASLGGRLYCALSVTTLVRQGS